MSLTATMVTLLAYATKEDLLLDPAVMKKPDLSTGLHKYNKEKS